MAPNRPIRLSLRARDATPAGDPNLREAKVTAIKPLGLLGGVVKATDEGFSEGYSHPARRSCASFINCARTSALPFTSAGERRSR